MPEPPFIRDSGGSVREGHIVLAGSTWQGEIAGELTFIRIDHQTRLQFGEVEVVIETPFVLTLAGTDHLLDPADRDGLGRLLGIYPDSLTSGQVEPDGTLVLHFAGGASVSVRPDPSYEAWSVVGPGSALNVCVPGASGELAIWS